MKIYSPVFVAARVIVYSLLMVGIAETLFFDALHPVNNAYFSEITLTEIFQEIIMFTLFAFYLFLAVKVKKVSAVSNLVSMFFLMSFIREFNNFLGDVWFYLVLVVIVFTVWLVIRDFKKIKQACIEFFSVPASTWLMSGFVVTYVFSRLFGRSKFWLLIYSEEYYRLAKSASEEGVELLGDTLLLIGAIEFALYFFVANKNNNK